MKSCRSFNTEKLQKMACLNSDAAYLRAATAARSFISEGKFDVERLQIEFPYVDIFKYKLLMYLNICSHFLHEN